MSDLDALGRPPTVSDGIRHLLEPAPVHLDEDCRDRVNGDSVADELATYGAVTCRTCRAVAERLC